MRRGDFNEKSPDFDSNTGAQSASDGAICRTGKGCDKIMRKYVRFERLMDHPNTQALHSYWNDLRDGRDAPYRSEIDPRRIRGALETMFILETTQEGGLRFRLAGTKLCEMSGQELRGRSAESLMIFGHERELTLMARRTLGEPGVGVMRVRAEHQRAPEGESWAGEILLLPMRSELGDMTRILGAVNLADVPRITRAPMTDLRLRCLGARMLPIDIDPERASELEPAAPTSAPARTTGMAESGARFARRPAPVARKETPPALVTIQGNPGAARGGEKRSRGHLRLVTD